MPELPTVANIVAQVSISGSMESENPQQAPRARVVDDMVALGVPQAAVADALVRALSLGIIEARAGDDGELLTLVC